MDNSSASFDDRVTIRTAIASDILQARSISSNGVGKGTIRVARTVTSPTARMMLLCEAGGVLKGFDHADSGEFNLSEIAIIIPVDKRNLPRLRFA